MATCIGLWGEPWGEKRKEQDMDLIQFFLILIKKTPTRDKILSYEVYLACRLQKGILDKMTHLLFYQVCSLQVRRLRSCIPISSEHWVCGGVCYSGDLNHVWTHNNTVSAVLKGASEAIDPMQYQLYHNLAWEMRDPFQNSPILRTPHLTFTAKPCAVIRARLM